VTHDYRNCERCFHDLTLYGEAYYDTGNDRHIPPPEMVRFTADSESFTESQKRTITARFARVSSGDEIGGV
jgi:hypothetical protein